MKLNIYIILYLLAISLSFTESAKFKIAYKDSKSKKVKESHPVKRATRIQCAAHCLRKTDCDGFSLDSAQICRILKGTIQERECPGTECVDRKGYSVFKKNE